MGAWPFWRKAESIWILRPLVPAVNGAITPDWAEGVLVYLEDNGHLEVKKFWQPGNIKNFFTFSFSPAAGGIAIAVNPPLVYTETIRLNFYRQQRGPLSPDELENILAQFVGKIFSSLRLRAAKEIGVDDLDAVLVDSYLDTFRVGGRRVVNPLGIDFKHLEAEVEFTFTSREVFNALRPAFSFLKHRPKKKFLFSDAFMAQRKVLSRLYSPPPGVLVLHPERGYLLTDAGTKKLGWSVLSLIRLICDAWAVSPAVAEKIYLAYLRSEVSPAVARKIGRIIRPAVDLFWQCLEKLHPRGRVLVSSEIELPFTLPASRRRFSLEKVDLADIMSRLGFSGDISFPCLAVVAEIIRRSGGSPANKWLRRYLHWLGAPI